MNRIHKRRLYYVSIFIISISLACSLILYALKQNINAFLTPKQVAENSIDIGSHFRLGGMVKKNSVRHDAQGLGVNFIVTDLQKELSVRYVGILPDLFREGTGVIAEGELDINGVFNASQVLAKHDENYMPKNIYKVNNSGWRDRK